MPLATNEALAAALVAVGAAMFVPVNRSVFPVPAHVLVFKSIHNWSTSAALNVLP